MGGHALIQGIFPTQGLNLCLLHLHWQTGSFFLSLLYNIVLVLPYINMNPPWVYTCFQSWTPPPTSLPIPSLWVIPVHQPQASCILHRTWTGDSFLIWYYTCFNAILTNHLPPPSPTESKRLFYTSVSDRFFTQVLRHLGSPNTVVEGILMARREYISEKIRAICLKCKGKYKEAKP